MSENIDDYFDEIVSIKMIQDVSGIGPVRLFKIYKRFNSFIKFIEMITKKIYEPEIKRYISPKQKKDLIKKINNKKDFYVKYMSNQIKLSKYYNGKIITYWDFDYPKKLLSTNQPIPLLYTIGNTNLLHEKKYCSVVGTRNPSELIKLKTKEFVNKFVLDNYVIISGLAKGIDAIAQKTALESGGKTISILGNGPDIYYPKINIQLQRRIMNEGLIISEYPYGINASPLGLKKRNKIIVGLSDFVLITETSTYGGTMNSYTAAKEQNKNVKVFLPNVLKDGNFSGNIKILSEGGIIIDKIKIENNYTNKIKVDCILFDLDGTLIHSEEAVYTTIKKALERKNITYNKQQFIKDMKKLNSTNDIIKKYQLTLNNYWKIYKTNYDLIYPYDSLKEDLIKIKEKKKIGIVTHCKKEIVYELLKKIEMGNLFDVIITPSDTRARKPNPKSLEMAINHLKCNIKNTVYIGNEDIDINAAKNAGCLSAVGIWSKSLQITINPDLVLESITDLMV